jgi:hypothetical protein
MGNRLHIDRNMLPCPEDAGDEWEHFSYKTTIIKNIVVHSKNDRRVNNAPSYSLITSLDEEYWHLLPAFPRRGGDAAATVEYSLPRGNLVKLLLTHIEQGHQLITQCTGERMIRLFSSRSGLELTNINFVHVWKHIMSKHGKGQVGCIRSFCSLSVLL